jgi:CRISPR/Cas system-associated endonuclease Cas1
MTVTDLLNQIKKNLKERRLEIAESLIQGRVSDFESYQKNVGIAEGLQQASEVINETLNKLNEEDE